MKHKRFNQLSKDEIFTIAMLLDLPEILALCRTAKKFNRNVCQNKNFWISRLKQDFGYSYLDISPDKTGNPKEYYEFFHKYRGNNNRLMVAAKEGNIDIVRFMIKKGSNIHANNDQALLWASKYGHTEIVKLLIKEGANIHVVSDYALRLASENGHTDTVKLLLENGADIHAVTDYALILASMKGHTDTVKLLLENGANIHANYDEALRWASNKGHTETVKVLENGAKLL